MINDVDDALRRLLQDRALGDGEAEVVLDAPVAGWREGRPSPVVDLHLYDLCEDVDRRPADWEDARDTAGRRVGRRQPPRRYLLSYAITAWASSVEEEHRLLSRALTCLACLEHLPADCLRGTLSGEPVSVSVALPRRIAAGPAHGPLPRPALHVVVGATLRPAGEEAAGPPVRERRISVAQPGGEPEPVASRIADLALSRAAAARPADATTAPRRTWRAR